jgi:uncharacterized membrane protein YfhO
MDGRRSRLLKALAAVILLGGTTFTIVFVMAPVNREVAFQPPEEHTNYAIIPRTAPAQTDDMAEMERTTLDGADGRVSIHEWKPQHRAMEITSGAAASLLVRTFNYPGWTAALDGRAAAIDTDRESGAMRVSIPAGTHVLTLDFLDTPVRRRGAWITMVSFVAVCIALAIGLLTGLRRGRESPASFAAP